MLLIAHLPYSTNVGLAVGPGYAMSRDGAITCRFFGAAHASFREGGIPAVCWSPTSLALLQHNTCAWPILFFAMLGIVLW